MFTGLIEEIGQVKSTRSVGSARQVVITAQKALEETKVDDSICVSGTCLTVISMDRSSFTVQAVDETLRKTTLGNLRTGKRVNLERAVRLSDRLGGHLVQGHIDGVGRILNFEQQSYGKLMRVELPAVLLRYVIPLGSIALEGVSLTIARLDDPVITVALIPHTLEQTNLGEYRPGDHLNVEVDIIGKYIERLIRSTK